MRCALGDGNALCAALNVGATLAEFDLTGAIIVLLKGSLDGSHVLQLLRGAEIVQRGGVFGVLEQLARAVLGR